MGQTKTKKNASDTMIHVIFCRSDPSDVRSSVLFHDQLFLLQQQMFLNNNIIVQYNPLNYTRRVTKSVLAFDEQNNLMQQFIGRKTGFKFN